MNIRCVKKIKEREPRWWRSEKIRSRILHVPTDIEKYYGIEKN